MEHAVRHHIEVNYDEDPELFASFAQELLEILNAPQVQAVQTLGLTPREMEVLRLLGRKASNRDIAEDLVISLPTVKTHIAHIFRKLSVSSRGDAVEKARQLHML